MFEKLQNSWSLVKASGEVLSIDYTGNPPTVSQGTAVLLDDLALKGLKDESAKDEKGRQFNCPHCGAPVTVALATSKSVTCGSCNSIIDLSSGIGGELRSAIQDEPVQPLIALGTLGQLQGTQWQVVGFQHRMGQTPGDDEQFGWSEYLLYNQKQGFSFLVDSEEGWSLVRPTTGAPTVKGTTATYMGKTYTLKYSYQAETYYVCGEFYWPVQRGQKTSNQDYAAGRSLLSLEQTPGEAVWSAGDQINADAVAKAVRAMGADVVALQEIENQTALTAISSRLRDLYPTAVLGETDFAASIDVAVLGAGTLLEVRKHRSMPLKRPDGSTTYFSRELLEVHLDLKGRRVVLFAAHFRSKVSDDPGRRLAEAQASRDIVVATAKEFPAAVVLLGGDLNDTPGSPPLDAMESVPSLLRVAKDRPPELVTTYVWNGKAQAIDHLFLALSAAANADYVPASAIAVHDAMGSGLAGSDHAALVADIGLR